MCSRYSNTPMSQCVVHFMCSETLKCLIQHSSEPVYCNVNCYVWCIFIIETQLNVTVTVYCTHYHASIMEIGSNKISFESLFTLIVTVQVPAS